MSIIAASRLRGLPEPNVFINGVGSDITAKEDLFASGFLLSGNPSLVSNFKNNGKDVSFYYDGKLSGFSDGAQNVKSIFLLGDVLNTYFTTSLDGSSNTFETFIATSNFVCNNEAFRNKNFLKRVYVPNLDNLGNTIGDDAVFRNTGGIELVCNNNLSIIDSGSPDGDITDLINNWNGTVTYSTDKTNPTAPTISTNTIGGTFAELNVSQPTHVNTLKYALVFVDGFFQDVYDINNVYVTNLQQQTNYDIKVIIADEYFNISPYSNTLNVTTTTTPALFQNAVAYYKLDETSGDAIDVVNGYNGTLFGGVTRGVAGKIGTAYSFTNGRVDLPNSIYNNFNVDNYVISFWFKLDSISGVKVILGQNASDINKRNIFILQVNDILSCQVEDNGTRPSINTSSLVANQWYFLQFKSDFNSVFEVKLNNVIQGTYTYVNPTAYQDQISIGDRSVGSSLPFEGDIDEVSFINGQTTTGQDSDLYNNGSGTTI
jgi:hypothetical protein